MGSRFSARSPPSRCVRVVWRSGVWLLGKNRWVKQTAPLGACHCRSLPPVPLPQPRLCFLAGDHGRQSCGWKSLQRPQPHHRRQESKCEPGVFGSKTEEYSNWWGSRESPSLTSRITCKARERVTRGGFIWSDAACLSPLILLIDWGHCNAVTSLPWLLPWPSYASVIHQSSYNWIKAVSFHGWSALLLSSFIVTSALALRSIASFCPLV